MNVSVATSQSAAAAETSMGTASYRKQGLSFMLNVIPVQTASAAEATSTSLTKLPAPRNGRFSLRDLVSVLDRSGREAFEQQGVVQNAKLRERHERGEISSLFFYRCLARMTQEQLAERAHSRQSFVSQLEKRQRPLTWKQATKLARALGIEPAQLMEQI
jgi:DNA-binding XRE family transcriptional regulator